MMAIPSIDMEATGRNITRLTAYRPRPAGNFRFHQGNLQVAARHRHAGIDNLVVLAAVLHVSIDEIVIVETRELVLACMKTADPARRRSPKGDGPVRKKKYRLNDKPQYDEI